MSNTDLLRTSLPELPFKVEVVAPDLKKPGLIVYAPTPQNYAYHLLGAEENKITQQVLRDYGFVVFDNHVQDGCYDHEFRVPTARPNQMPHQDGGGAEDQGFIERGFIVLRSNPGTEKIIRNRATAVGDRDEVFRELLRFFREEDSAVLDEYPLYLIDGLRGAINSLHIDNMSLDQLGGNQNDQFLKDKFFREGVAMHSYPRLHELLERVRPLMHRHRFGPHPQLLVIDNVNAVHCRVTDRAHETERDNVPVTFRLLKWNEQGEVVV